MTTKEALKYAKKQLVGTSEVESSSYVLLGEVLDMTRSEILADQEKTLTKSQGEQFKEFVERRKKHESVWHIIGKVGFWGMEYIVTEDVLVPRPETEILVEKVVNHILGLDQSEIQNSKPEMLDIGTGAGTIAVALAAEFPGLKITASDISKEALEVAEKNAKDNNVHKDIKFIKSDLFENIDGKFDIITANLPYIPSEDMSSLAIDVHHHEPKLALDGGTAGLEIYDRFFSQVGKHLKDNAAIFCEIGIDQGKPLEKIVKKYLPKAKVEILGDLAEIDRIAIIRTQ